MAVEEKVDVVSHGSDDEGPKSVDSRIHLTYSSDLKPRSDREVS